MDYLSRSEANMMATWFVELSCYLKLGSRLAYVFVVSIPHGAAIGPYNIVQQCYFLGDPSGKKRH